MATAQQPGLALAKHSYRWRGLRDIDSGSGRGKPISKPTSLCDACKSIRLWDGRHRKHLGRSRDLPASALNCPLCAMLDAKVREAYGARGFDCSKYPAKLSFEPIRVTAVTRDETGEGLGDEVLPYLFFNVDYFGADTAIKVDCALYAVPGTPASMALSTATKHSFTDTSSPAAHRLVSQWLERCILSHDKCRKTVSGETIAEDVEPELPKRVIDVSPPLGENFVCLIEARGSRGHYTTLSHCWGPPTLLPLTTTTGTIQDRLAGIEIESLPKSFQDAVQVTRATGTRFLWIDSLCIVQDDPNDWAEQCGQMGMFYERARFTIAAADAVNSHQGLFRPLSREAVPIQYHDKSGEPAGSIFVGRPEPPSRLEGSPLASRAWVTQEIMLSRRIISYSKYGLLWSCMSRNETEVGEKSVIFSILERSTDWPEIISLYSAKQLTYHKDKLVALQGIANSLEKKTGDRYLAGLWNSDLPAALLWSVKVRDWGDAGRLPSTLGLPSWSWASVDCAVSAAIPGMWAMRAYVACGEVTVQQAEGSLQLRVEGLLARAPELAMEVTEAVSATSNPSWDSIVSGSGSERALRIGRKRRLVPSNQVEMPDTLRYDFREGPNRLPAAIKFCKRERGADHVVGWCLMDDRRDVAGEAFVLRLLCKGDLGPESETGIYNFVLLLRRCEGDAEVYRRIGMGLIYGPRYSGWFKGIKQARISII